jgi:hypothetical protein
MNRFSKRLGLALVALTLLAIGGTALYSQGKTEDQTPRPARSRSDEMLDR